MFRLVALTILIFSFSSNALAERTGNELLRGCNAIIADIEKKDMSVDEVTISIFWTGYIAGYLDSSVLYETLTKTGAYCIPEKGVEGGQAAMIIANFLKNNPNQLHESARFCIFMALADAFKCK
ncbi:MAG: hypothetical protein KUA37_07130 [Desulfomicrobium sp.]|nr:hypothetical protein [Pseudomonadota bacterium]MBV1711764.1 hypothetical protein [Desulfomicrobium sp.]MBU4572648.1 hypothetical protein [Pseudomonadota bacterium]MBU4593571.1 hypothetical protein [Pseudomonadota bacterium]MBV1719174.1 hypothetical protein [Desulfomicrobium sp.]